MGGQNGEGLNKRTKKEKQNKGGGFKIDGLKMGSSKHGGQN